MIPIPPQALKLGAYGLVLGATYIGGCVRGSQIANDKLTQYRAQVEAAGKQAQRDADIKAAKDRDNAHASDLSYSKALVALGSDIERLRRARSYPGPLAAPAPSTVCPEGLRCLDREEFDTALSRYWEAERRSEEAIDGLIAEGATLKLRMDEAISWANRLNQ